MKTVTHFSFKGQGKKFIPGIAWFFVVFIAVTIPGKNLPKVDNWLLTIDYDKIIHVGIFGLLAFLFMLPIAKMALPKKQKWYHFVRVAIATVVWGITTELIQKFFIPGRSFDLMDWASDSIGGILAMFFCKWYYLRAV